MPSIPKPVTVDFETDRIMGRPAYPPKPVGVAIKWWGKKGRYYAWGHPTKNNCSKREATAALAKAYDCEDGVLFHNSKFDLDVAETHLKLKPPVWHHVHDTLFLLFLYNPHAQSLSLKPSAERLLNLPPEERDAVADWLVTHQPVPNVKISPALKSPNSFGAYIGQAPGDLVGRYAIGDVDRTAGLFKFLWQEIRRRDMLNAYDRERKLLPIVLEMERLGIQVDHARLARDLEIYLKTLSKIDAWLGKRLKTTDLNINSGKQLMASLIKANLVDLSQVGLTKTGQYKSDQDTIENAIKEPVINSILRYYSQLRTCVNTFMMPWCATADASGGLIFTSWNQVRQEGDGGFKGARTGRFSSNPNFQNIPNEFKPLFKRTGSPKIPGLPKAPFKLPPLPYMRDYIIPRYPGHLLLGRDYSQQELRILAHFEDGELLQAYRDDPWLDVHSHAQKMINSMLGTNFDRKPIKNTGFGLIYGMGLGTLAAKSGSSVEEAKKVRDSYLAGFPGLKSMYQEMKYRARANLPIRTWGGREYYCEPPKMINGRLRQFDYKMLNVLIQGSAADCTKEAIIRYDEVHPRQHFLLLSVHDELLASAPEDQLKNGMARLREAMEDVSFDVPMLSEGKVGRHSWHNMSDYDVKGKIIYNS